MRSARRARHAPARASAAIALYKALVAGWQAEGQD